MIQTQETGSGDTTQTLSEYVEISFHAEAWEEGKRVCRSDANSITQILETFLDSKKEKSLFSWNVVQVCDRWEERRQGAKAPSRYKVPTSCQYYYLGFLFSIRNSWARSELENKYFFKPQVDIVCRAARKVGLRQITDTKWIPSIWESSYFLWWKC